MSGYLASLRSEIEDGTGWEKFHETRPADMDERIDEIINAMSNVELLERIDSIDEQCIKGI